MEYSQTAMESLRRSTLIVFALLAATRPAIAAEYIDSESPPTDSVEKIDTPGEKAFEEDPAPSTTRINPWLVGEPRLNLRVRSYLFLRYRENGNHNEAWAGGGSVEVLTPRLLDFVSVGAELYTSQRLWGPESRDGTGLLQPRQVGITALGQIHANLSYRDVSARIFRQTLYKPFLNRNDSRMIPNTFQAYRLHDHSGSLRWDLAHVDRIKLRASNHFVSMSEAAGVRTGQDRGVTAIGAAWRPREGSALSVYNLIGWDVMNTLYVEADSYHALSDEIGLKLTAQFMHQKSIGDELLPEPGFDAWAFGARAALSSHGIILALAYTQVDRERRIRNPWGGFPGFNSLMTQSFNRAGERALGVRLSYDAARIGLPGLTAFGRYVHGSHAHSGVNNTSLRDVEEWNLTVDYRFPDSHPLRRFWIRVRGAVLDVEQTSRTPNQVRVILNYAIPVL
jgi:hypothetical protein